MDEKELLKKIKKESKKGVPDVYDKVMSTAYTQGLIADEETEEAYSDGETAVLGGVSRRAIAITSLVGIAAICLAIALPIALTGRGGLPDLAADFELGEEYAVGAVSTAKLAERFLADDDGEAYARSFSKPASLVVNPEKDGIERYISEFDNYFYACNSFFGEQPATVNYITNTDAKYDNSIIISGYFSNGDEARYAMYYSEARILGDTAVTGDEVKYYLEGYLYLNSKYYYMHGERVYTDSTRQTVKSLTITAYSSPDDKENRIEASVGYNADGSVSQYDFTVIRNGDTVSESVLIFPDASAGDEVYSIGFTGDDGDREGTFTVNRTKKNSSALSVGYEMGNLTSQFYVYANSNTLERIIAPDGLEYADNGDGTYRVSGYRKDAVLPEILLIPDEIDGIKVTSIGNSAFSSCESIKEVIIPEGITKIGSTAFMRCKNLSEISFPETVTEIGRQAFNGCVGIEHFTCPENLEIMGDGVFWGCTNLKTVEIPASVNSIGTGIFIETAVESVTVDSANEYYFVETGCLIEKATMTVLGGCVGFTVPDGAVSIGNTSFYNCKYFTSLILPASVKTVGTEAFGYTNIENLDMRGVEEISDFAFSSCKVKELVFPETLKSIGQGAFCTCSYLESVVFPASLESVDGQMTFSCSNLQSITVEAGNPVFHSVGNCLISTAENKLVLGCSTSAIPEDGSVQIIGKFAFYGQSLMTEIKLPAGLTAIEESAFAVCGLVSVTIPETVTVIDEYAFYGCNYLESVVASGSLREIGNEAFASCRMLASVELPEGLLKIGSGAFEYCEFALTKIVIPQSVTFIGSGAFRYCSQLKEVTLPNGITYLDGDIFKGCTNIVTIDIPSSVTTICIQAFYGCQSLLIINYDGTVEEWNKVQKDLGWDWDTGDYFVACTDGNVNKEV